MNKPIAPVTVSREKAPVKDVVIREADIDLSTIPIPVHNALDGGPYLTAAATVMRDPETGAQNVGIYRHHVFTTKEMGVWFFGSHHGGHIVDAYERRGERAPFAIAIGHHPAFLMGAAARLPGIGGEYEAAGALLGEPVELVEAETSDLMVPAQAEFIIEGYITPGQLHHEGPFGEWPGHYLNEEEVPIMTVTAITHRRDAIFQDIIGAGREHLLMGGMPRASTCCSAGCRAPAASIAASRKSCRTSSRSTCRRTAGCTVTCRSSAVATSMPSAPHSPRSTRSPRTCGR